MRSQFNWALPPFTLSRLSTTSRILDVRLGKDWKSSEFKIKGAIRTDPKQIDKWSENLRKENRLVLYCA